MEQTRRARSSSCCAQGTVLQPSSSCSSTQEEVYDITKKWEVSKISKRKEHKPGVTGSARPICGWSQEVHQGQSGDAHVHPRQEAWGPPVVVPWIDSVASRTPYTFQQDSAPAQKAKLAQSWLKKNVPNFLDFNTCPPNSPDLNPCDYYL
ncbi:Uncharacterized protein FKW44_006644 [Caligus rogercresseyi]|uniref:Uncharacterized protein n=1 Tax=Caligus rogercresseyi TaxID=217165 RepID=A0A7T8KDL8_CALRO|nr:Uncharacterized protein FKW44_006644 [Caligus rogercresseyi]